MKKCNVIVLIAQANDLGQIVVVAASTDPDTPAIVIGSNLATILADAFEAGFEIESIVPIGSGQTQYTLKKCVKECCRCNCNWQCRY